jgi:hypothetical protein
MVSPTLAGYMFAQIYSDWGNAIRHLRVYSRLA